MTTIAYKDGIIAYDSRITAANLIIDDNYDKCIESEGHYFFLSGATSDYPSFVANYLSGQPLERNLEVDAFVWNGDELFRAAVTEKELWRVQYSTEKSYALGWGNHFALAFMDTGMSAKQAVIGTTKFDSSTGGVIRTFTLANHVR